MKTKLLTVLAVLTLGACGLAWGQSVSVDHVDGTLIGSDTLMQDSTYTFYLRWQGPADRNVDGVTTGWRVHSPDGGTWTTTVIDTTGTLGGAQFDLVWQLQPAGWEGNVTGSGADTIGVGGAKMFGPGMPAGFDDIVNTITIGPIGQDDGKQICLDSSYYPPSGLWKWAAEGSVDYFPVWDGPHCYTIEVASDVSARPSDGLPTRWMMSQNYPNPFNPTTEIAFDVPSRSHVTLNVYNVLGQQVATLVDQELARGSYTADWDGTSTSGTAAASGVYFYRLEADQYIDTKKMVLMK